MRSNYNARHVLLSQSFSFKINLTTSARESLRATLRNPERFYVALTRIKASTKFDQGVPTQRRS